MKPFFLKSTLLATALALATISSSHQHATENESQQILADTQARQAWVRQAQKGQMTAAFVELTSSRDRQLVAVQSELAEFNEIHTHEMVDGMMQMRQVNALELTAQQSLILEPGGLHLMLINLQQDLEPNSQVTMQLLFADGSQAELALEVKPRSYLPTPSHPADDESKGHQGH